MTILRASVGRHNRTQLQNWAVDQMVVLTLLNRIPSSRGGCTGTLRSAIVAGICGDELSEAILRFQRANFPGHVTGHIDRHGSQIALLERLATQATPHIPPAQVARVSAAIPTPPSVHGSTVDRLPDGGTLLRPLTPNDRDRLNVASAIQQLSISLRGNPNRGNVINFLQQRLQHGTYSIPPTLFGYCQLLNEQTDRFHNATPVVRGTPISTRSGNGNAIVLLPSGGYVELSPNTLFVLLGRYGIAREPRETAEDVHLTTGSLRDFVHALGH
jgi:hypothetical protein